MLPEIQPVLEVFEELSFDDKAFFSFKNEENLEVVALYSKKQDKKNWSIWFAINEQASKQTLSATHIKKAIKAYKISEKQFIQQITDMLMTQAMFANEFIDQLSRVFGEEAVQNNLSQAECYFNKNDSILNSLSEIDILKEHLKRSNERLTNKTKLKIVK